MDTIKYGNELLKTGGLTWKRNTKEYQYLLEADFYMEWTATSSIFDSPCSEEEIVYFSAKKIKYKSPLHFAWKNIAFYREFESKLEIIEAISETQFEKIDIKSAYSIIWKASQNWAVKYKLLLPKSTNAYLIWNDGLDIYLVLEDEEYYYAWNWLSTA